MSDNYTDGKDFIYANLTSNELANLSRLRFVVDNDDNEVDTLIQEYDKCLQGFSQTLYLTVEMTTACNFTCGFCYQQTWEKRQLISNETICNLIKVINDSDLSQFSDVNLNVIGGEPLMNIRCFTFLVVSLQKLCRIKGLNLSIKLNTNGYNLNRSVLHILKNTEIMFPFLTEFDYSNGVVRYKKDSSYINLHKVLKTKIESIVPDLNGELSNKLIFRFNANHNNINYIEDYFKEITSFGLKNKGIFLVNTRNVTKAPFTNTLSDLSFFDWYYSVVMPLCAKYKIDYPIVPRYNLSRCKARRLGSFKLFSDGRIGLCNGIDYNFEMPHISDISSLSDINDLYKDIKGYHYIRDNRKCMNCQFVYMCGGPSPCKDQHCINVDNLSKFIRAKVELKTEK